jgi:hypothetical protein
MDRRDFLRAAAVAGGGLLTARSAHSPRSLSAFAANGRSRQPAFPQPHTHRARCSCRPPCRPTASRSPRAPSRPRSRRGCSPRSSRSATAPLHPPFGPGWVNAPASRSRTRSPSPRSCTGTACVRPRRTTDTRASRSIPAPSTSTTSRSTSALAPTGITRIRTCAPRRRCTWAWPGCSSSLTRPRTSSGCRAAIANSASCCRTSAPMPRGASATTSPWGTT